MYRKIIKAANEDDLNIQLPAEYLNKEVKVIAFEIEEDERNVDEVNDFSDALNFFNKMQIDMLDFKFNRDEAS
jgi:hypothetical protein